MSEWYELEDDDIEICPHSNDIIIFVKQDNFGSVFALLRPKQIADIYHKLNGHLIEPDEAARKAGL